LICPSHVLDYYPKIYLLLCFSIGIIPFDYGQSGCADYVVLQEFDVGKYQFGVVIAAVFIILYFCSSYFFFLYLQ
jgi:hypothetical protein